MKLHLEIIFSYFAIHFWSKDFQVAYTFDILNVFVWHFFVISYLHRQNEMIGWNENQKYSVIPSYLFYTGCIFDPICIHNGVHHIENSVFLLLCTTSCHHHHHVLLLQFYFRVTVLVKMSSRTHTHTPKYVSYYSVHFDVFHLIKLKHYLSILLYNVQTLAYTLKEKKIDNSIGL